MVRRPSFATEPSVTQDTLDHNVHSTIETGKPSADVGDMNDCEISSSSSMDESTSSARSVSSEAPIGAGSFRSNGSPDVTMSDSSKAGGDSAIVSVPTDDTAVRDSDHTQLVSALPGNSEEIPTSVEPQYPDNPREESSDSDAYEPPEPVTAAENPEIVSRLSFSPASHSPETTSAIMPSPSASQDNPLTERVQEPVEEPDVTEEPVDVS